MLVAYAALVAAVGKAAPRRIVLLGAAVQVAAHGLALVDVVRVLGFGATLSWELPWQAPFFACRLALDPLGAVFVAALALVGLAIAVYAPSYLEGAGHKMSAPVQQALLAVLEASIFGVMVADDVIGLLLAWELMTALATALVLADGHKPEVVRAAILYGVITHVGSLLAVGGLLWLSASAGGELSFAALREAGRTAGPGVRTGVALLTLIGFGSKAGIVPLHIWLPEAHPVAPSHVSALLSGVILKSGIYAVLRVNLDLLAPTPSWFGFLLLACGLSSALLGVLYALVQHDMKRLLAFHSVENIGIILLGVGLGVCAQGSGLPALAAVAMAAGLFHVVNHAVFKALLFLCAGSIHLGTHTHDIEELGALAKRMPSTARSFLVGAIAISALPPLNGFASEWLIMQGFIGSASAPQGLLRACSPILAAGLALTGALAATCFVKAYGVAFLALPRSSHAEHATEAPLAMRLAQNGLAVACVLLGLGAPWIVSAISRAAVALDPRYPLLGAGGRLGSLGGSGIALVQPLALGAVLALAIGAALLVLHRKAPKPRAALTWACGVGTLDGRAEYTASAFAKPIRRIFAKLYRPERDVEVVEGEAPYFVRRSHTRGSITPLFEKLLYQPALQALRYASEVLAPWSSSTLNRGLMLMSLTLAALLLWAST